jgi:hypothetical protein
MSGWKPMEPRYEHCRSVQAGSGCQRQVRRSSGACDGDRGRVGPNGQRCFVARYAGTRVDPGASTGHGPNGNGPG